MPGNDFVYAARVLPKSPVFTLTAAVTLALGIGASTAIFSVTNAVLLRPLPYKNPGRLVVAAAEMRRRNVKDWPFSNADFFDLRNGTRASFSELAGVFTDRELLPRQDGTPEEVLIAEVTPNLFRTLGAQIALGRDFTEADGQPQPPVSNATANQPTPQRPPSVAILSYEYFERRYGGNRSVIGQSITTAGGGGPQIVGVLAPRFQLLLPASANTEANPDLWVAARLAYDNAARNAVSLHVIGRLKDGATLDRAQAQANTVAAELRRNFRIHNTAGFFIQLDPMRRHLVESVQPTILALMGAVLFLLLIACANIANLMLVRMSARQREFAIRTSLGGNWIRIVRQLLSESLLLAAIGTFAGLALAWFGIRELIHLAPANLPRLDFVRIDLSSLAFTAVAGLSSAAFFGLFPAIRAARPNPMQVLRGSSRTAGLSGNRMLSNAVVIAEISLCFVLLVGSGLMFRSFITLQHIDPGFDPRHLLTFELLGPRAAAPQQRAASLRDLRDHLSALPGVQSVTAASPLPLTGGFTPIRWGTSEALTDPSKFQAVDVEVVLPGYFDAMQTPLITGRTFTEADNAPDRNLVVIDQLLASKAFPFESSIGKRILIRIRTPEPEWVEIIGVVAHQRANSLAEPGREQIFFADGFLGHGAVLTWAIRTAGDPESYANAVRKQISSISPHSLIARMQPMQVWVEQAQAGTRFSLLLIATFASIAALLAGVGLYGVLSSVVRQRTPEIGVRMALGARPTQIFGLIVGNGLSLSVIGIAIGIAAASALTRLMTSMLVGVKASDPLTFGIMAMLFLTLAALASWLPARRASALDPTAALHDN